MLDDLLSSAGESVVVNHGIYMMVDELRNEWRCIVIMY